MQYLIEQTEVFAQWFRELRDLPARAAIARRIDAIRGGNLGDSRSVGGRVSELRVHVGAGYRVYFTVRQRVVVVLLCGGDKNRQRADILRAQRLLEGD